MYYPNLNMYDRKHKQDPKDRKSLIDSIVAFLTRFGKRAAMKKFASPDV